MFQKKSTFFQTLKTKKTDSDLNELRIAAVALLFHIADANGMNQTLEKNTLQDIVARQYALAGGELKKLVESGKRAQENAIDLFSFTTILKQNLTKEERVSFISLLWEVAYADGHVYELEDNLIWRIAELLDVDRSDQLALKSRISEGIIQQPVAPSDKSKI